MPAIGQWAIVLAGLVVIAGMYRLYRGTKRR
jgi:hypothetical protein